MTGTEYASRKRRYDKAVHDLKAALYTLREHPESTIARKAVIEQEAEFEEARVSLWEAQAVFAHIDSERLGEEIEA